jgi:hypothetical protein
LLRGCWEKVAGETFVSQTLLEFKQDYNKFYTLLKRMRDDFHQDVHTIGLVEGDQHDFLLRLSRNNLPALDDFLKQSDLEAKQQEEQRVREETKINLAKHTSE